MGVHSDLLPPTTRATGPNMLMLCAVWITWSRLGNTPQPGRAGGEEVPPVQLPGATDPAVGHGPIGQCPSGLPGAPATSSGELCAHLQKLNPTSDLTQTMTPQEVDLLAS